ncbi:hypothetical protein H8E77_22010 [bacterium]|nr:hypothetical protein [bacterium]
MNITDWIEEISRAYEAMGKGLTVEKREAFLFADPNIDTDVDLDSVIPGIQGIVDEFVEVIYQHFFRKVVHGETFGPISRVEERLGKSLEENYGVSEGPFLSMAKTYWTFKFEVHDLVPEYKDVVIYQLLANFEISIAGTFFPTEGPISGPSIKQRKEAQRRFLERLAPEIDIERFLAENPMLRSQSGCLGGGMRLVFAAFVRLFC